MNKGLRVAAVAAAIGIAALSPTTPAYAGDAWGAGFIGFGVGALLGSLFTPVYVVPPPYYYGPVVYDPPPPYYDEYDYYGPPEGRPHWHNHRPAAHTTSTDYDKPQPRTAKANRKELSP